jgi:hypothetical protein
MSTAGLAAVSLTCKDCAQLSGPAHAPELRKPCREMASGAWESSHGGSCNGSQSSLLTPRLRSELQSGGGVTGVAPAGWPGVPS